MINIKLNKGKSIYFSSDNHLGAPNYSDSLIREKLFISWLDKIKKDAQVIFLASVLGGGIFGDHCSPISDTTIISSMAAGSNHIDHVRTQLPYALISAFISIILYIIV